MPLTTMDSAPSATNPTATSPGPTQPPILHLYLDYLVQQKISIREALYLITLCHITSPGRWITEARITKQVSAICSHTTIDRCATTLLDRQLIERRKHLAPPKSPDHTRNRIVQICCPTQKALDLLAAAHAYAQPKPKKQKAQ
jgi:hypothetical protein